MYPLYNIEPIGFGTSQAESTVSYDFRLANAHRVPVRTLNVRILVPLIQGPYRRTLEKAWSFYAASSMVSIGKTSEAWATALNLATGRTDLQLGTLNFTAGFLSPLHLHAKVVQYCRECLQDALDNNAEPWMPLLWHLAIVTACPIHRVKLRTRQCGDPDNAVYISFRRILPENCWTCGRLLCLCDNSPSVPATNEEVAIAEIVGELIAVGTSGVYMPPDALQLCNDAIPTVLGENWMNRSSKAANINIASVHQMFRVTGKRTTLPGLVAFCLCNKLSLSHLAIGVVQRRDCVTPCPHRTWRYQRADVTRIRKEIQKAIDADGKTSLRELGKKLNHSQCVLESAAPDLAAALKLSNAAFRITQINLYNAESKKRCREIIEELLKRGLSLTLNNVRELTGEVWFANSKPAKLFLAMREEYFPDA